MVKHQSVPVEEEVVTPLSEVEMTERRERRVVRSYEEKKPDRTTSGLVGFSFAVTIWAMTTTILLAKSKKETKYETNDWAPLPKGRLHRIAFGSCAEQENPAPYWDTLVMENADLVILMGDNVYGDCETEGCPELGEAYQTLETKPSFAGAKSRVPTIAVWDDHDYGLNDGYGTNNQYKDMAKDLFLKFFDISSGDERRDEGRGLFTSYKFEDQVQILLLDTRWYRS